MDTQKSHTVEIWAQLLLCERDCSRVHKFLVSEFGIKPSRVLDNMHITVYHARRPMPGICSLIETACVLLPVSQTRFMVLAPGGENPGRELHPGKRKVGIRVRRQSGALAAILDFRARLLKHETRRMLGSRLPSTHNKSAFGARYFQPHMAILRAGSGIPRDLKIIGVPFREALGDLMFDRFRIKVVRRLG